MEVPPYFWTIRDTGRVNGKNRHFILHLQHAAAAGL
jgi:hypothetical protein